MVFLRQSTFSSPFSRFLILLAGLGMSLGMMGRAEAQSDLYVGSNSANQTTNFFSGTNSYSDASYVGYSDAGNTNLVTNNTLVVSNSGTVLSITRDAYIGYNGYEGSSNGMIIADGGFVTSDRGYIGYSNNVSNSYVLVTGSNSLWTNRGFLYVGFQGGGSSLMISNGGKVASDRGYIGYSNNVSNSYVLVTGSNSLWTNSGSLYVGLQGSGNSLVISNGGQVINYDGNIGYFSRSSNNSVVVTGSNSLWSNRSSLYVGFQGGGSSLMISNGGQVINYDGIIGNFSRSSNNSVVVTGNNSLWTNSGDLTVGYSGSSNSLVISNGGKVANNYAYIGYNSRSSNNSVVVTGNNSLWTNSGILFVGNAGSGNSLMISNGGKVVNYYGIIGYDSTSSNNSVVVTGSNSLWSNRSSLYVGYEGSLTVANGGSVWASNIIIAPNSNSTGTVNIGSLGGSDTAGTLVTPTISFGSGTGKLNFNQANQFTLTSSITGRGAVQQLGTGTTILSGNNSYTGTTLISAGTLRTASTNALGTSAVTLTNSGVLSLATNLTISSLVWNGSASIALINITNGPALSITSALSLSGPTHSFDFANNTQVINAMELMSWGVSNSYTIDNYSVLSSVSYTLSISNNALWYNPTSDLIALSTGTTVTNTATFEAVAFQTNGVLIVDPTAKLTITSGVSPTNNGSVIIQGELTMPNVIIPEGGSTYLVDGKLNGDIENQVGGYLFVDPSTVNGSVTNSGVMSIADAGNVITGNLVLTGSSVFEVATGATLNVGGSATLGGSLVVSSVLPFGTKEAFLSASSISGSFASIVAPETQRIRLLLELTGADTTAYLLFAPASYTQLAANGNQVNVARALDSFIPATSGDRLVISTSLDSLTASQYNQAFNAIMPTMYKSVATIAFNSANAQNMELEQRLWGLRVAGSGFSMNGFGNTAIYQKSENDPAKGVLDSKNDILRPGLDNHWGMFVDGNGIFARANSGNMLPGYNSQGGGVTTGLTYRWNDSFGTGLYCGYQGTYTKMGANGSGLGTGSRLIDNAVRFGGFATWGQKNAKGEAVGFYANALAGGAYHNEQVTRVIQYTGVNRTANSAPGVGELDTMIAGGYDVKKGNFTFGPSANLQYTYLQVNNVNETGAQALNFNSSGWNTESMLSSVGAHAAYSWIPNKARKDIVVVPQVSLNWQHEFLQNPYNITGNLGGTSPTFSNTSATGIRDYLYTGVGLTVEFAKRWNTSFFYNAAAGNKDLVSQNIFWSMGAKF